MYSLSRYDSLQTKQKSLYYVFVGVYVNLCTVTVIELIVFSYNEVNETCNHNIVIMNEVETKDLSTVRGRV